LSLLATPPACGERSTSVALESRRAVVRIFLAGATGVLGVRLVPLLVEGGHAVAGVTRSPAKTDGLRALGAEPVVCDLFDTAGLRAAVVSFAPDAVMHQATDLPDDPRRFYAYAPSNNRIRREGTRNLLAAAHAAGTVRHFVAQSVAWQPAGEAGAAVEALERAVLEQGGVVLRYGRLYGHGTYYESHPPPPPRIHVDEAARRTVAVLAAASGVHAIVEDESA
jgi:nucleoside-diphosphate-sugar epimerase